MPLLNRQTILDAMDLQTMDIDVPEWGGSVRIRSFTGADRDAFMSRMNSTTDRVTGTSAFLVSLSVVDEAGNRQFMESDLTTINGKAGTAVGVLADAIMKLNKLGPQADAETEKNSAPGQTG